MLKKRSKVQQRLAKVVMAALLCTNAAQAVWTPSVAEAAEADERIEVTVSKVTFDEPSSTIQVTANPDYSVVMSTRYYTTLEFHPTISSVGDVNIIGSEVPVLFRGDYPGEGGEVPVDGHTVTVSGKDTVMGGVVGARNNDGTVNNNHVVIKEAATIAGSRPGSRDRQLGTGVICGAGSYGTNATITNNTVLISGAKIGSEGLTAAIGGGNAHTLGTATVTNNTVTIEEDATVYADLIEGGYAYAESSVTAEKNQVFINSGTVIAMEIIGGHATRHNDTVAKGNNNTVTISGGTVAAETIIGGYAYADGTIDASGNNVIISGGTVTAEEIIGGQASRYYYATVATANNNTVTISGSDTKLQGEEVWIVGGEAHGNEEGGMEASNNTVNILTPLTVYALFGGYTEGISQGNTLNIAAKNVTAAKVDYFQNMNFYLPSDVNNGDTMLTIKGDVDEDDGEVYGNDLTGVTFGVAALKGVNLKKGDKVNLVVGEKGLKTDDQLKTTSSEELGKAEFLQQNSMTTEEKYELSIKKEGDNAIVTTVDNVKEEKKDDPDSQDAQKSPVETRMAVMTMINAGTDLLAGQGMANAEAAAQEVKGSSSMFAAVSGGQLRAESGSHVTTKGLGLNLGFAKEIENKSGKLMFGPVLEYGHGNYDSYQDNGMTADGKASYWGLGFIAKQTNDNGFYYEGSVRVGRAKSDYGSDSIVENSHISYDSTATYWAAHLGAGKVMDIGHNNTMDYYGKYFYSHMGGDSATIYRDGQDFDEITFSGVNSNRLRVGARLTHALNEKNNIYAGLAYQYEFSGTARATYREGAAPSPGVKGSSGMIELGWQVKPGKKSPMAIDLGVTGWVGKQRGVTANLQANWTF